MSDNNRIYPLASELPPGKGDIVDMYARSMLARTLRMFVYSGLPETIRPRELEIMMQSGNPAGVVIAQADDADGGSVWAYRYAPAGKPNRYYMPTQAIVANPTLSKSYTYTVYSDNPAENNAVVIRNDSAYLGTWPITVRAAQMLAENDITMRIVDITARAQSILSAADDNTKKSAESYLRQLYDGRLGVIVADTDIIDTLRVHPFSGNMSALTDCIEYHQYIKSTWYNDMGLSANYNMKREAINSQEAQIGRESLLPLVDDMLQCRREGLEACNAMFGWNATVELSDAWQSALDAATGDISEEVVPDETT